MTAKLETYTITRHIPEERLQAYLGLGWKQINELETGEVSVRKNIQTKMPSRSDMCVITKPRLIQRGKIRRPLGEHADGSLTSSIDFDYMGAAEFEFGALPRSLRRIEAQWSLYKSLTFSPVQAEVGGRMMPLQVYANFDSVNQESAYLEMLLQTFVRDDDLKEPLGAQLFAGKVTINKCDFWWDIRNDVFFSFDKQYMSSLNNHLQASFRILNSN